MKVPERSIETGSNPINPSPASRIARVCQYRYCRESGAKRVLAEFQKQADREIEIQACQCLGQCGNGPAVAILPEGVIYCRVLPKDVAVIIDRHRI
jgi:(2Fe-2S) ferredoxin